MTADLDDFVAFKDDQVTADTQESAVAKLNEPHWRILVVDDDADVHSATEFALTGLYILDRPLQFLHAYSAAEAIDTLMTEPDVAVVLLDVVMESEEAGLSAITTIRTDLGLKETQIILRTGQPGYAPEVDTIRRYDINDYRTKSELSRVKLYTALTASIRSYDHLRQLAQGRKGMELVMRCTGDLLNATHVSAAFAVLLTRAIQLVNGSGDAVIASDALPLNALYGTGCFSHLAETTSSDGVAMSADVSAQIAQALSERRSLVEPKAYTLYLVCSGQPLALHIIRKIEADTTNRALLDMFCSSTAVCIDNLKLVERLSEIAFHDALTGLGNRRAFVDELNRRLENRSRENLALMLLDVDQFAEINDMFGHGCGDELLRGIGGRLRDSMDKDVFVARLAADTFALIGAPDAIKADKLRELFAQPFTLEGESRFVSISSGYVHVSETELDADGSDLLKDASIVIKRAKEQGQGRHVRYTPEYREETRSHTRLLHELGQAFRQHELFLVYQPQVALSDRRVIGVEALLRWRKADGSMVPPDRFIPIAENAGLIKPIGDWVLQQAYAAVQQIHAAGHATVRMAVNVSAKQLNSDGFLHHLDSVLASGKVDPAYIELEVTESVSILGFDEMYQYLSAFRARGLEVAIDDFGTGYSSLSYLDRLPANRLKIDRSFVNALTPENTGPRIAEMVIPLGRQLGMKVLAEGVETEAQAEHLKALGCEEAQGYLFARPMPMTELLPWLDQRAASTK
jgi:diguanylate cyclase